MTQIRHFHHSLPFHLLGRLTRWSLTCLCLLASRSRELQPDYLELQLHQPIASVHCAPMSACISSGVFNPRGSWLFFTQIPCIQAHCESWRSASYIYDWALGASSLLHKIHILIDHNEPVASNWHANWLIVLRFWWQYCSPNRWDFWVYLLFVSGVTTLLPTRNQFYSQHKIQ